MMINLDNILMATIADATSVGFPVSQKLHPKIVVDKNRYDRVGACYRYRFPERYEIHVSDAVRGAKLNEIKNIIAHEVLHTTFLTMDHNCFWQIYKNKMNDMFGYNIQISYSWDEILK